MIIDAIEKCRETPISNREWFLKNDEVDDEPKV
jgi:hypothetical protein